MEVNPKLPEDLHFDDELDHDDGDFVYEYESEVGEDNNMEPALGEGNNAVLDFGSDSSNDYSSNSDSEHEIQLPLPPRPNRKRGMTRLAKLCTNFSRSGGKKKHVKFDELGRFSGKNRALFVSYLGDLVRQRVGIRVYSWKAVTPEFRDKLWEELTDVSQRTIEARKHLTYSHGLGRGGYTTLREKLVSYLHFFFIHKLWYGR
ncbi:hypothetical protein LXL04_034349 [Taraxacum kok-saghyz]